MLPRVWQFIAVAAGVLVSYIGDKIISSQLGFISNDVWREIVAGVLAVILGAGTMFLILRGKGD